MCFYISDNWIRNVNFPVVTGWKEEKKGEETGAREEAAPSLSFAPHRVTRADSIRDSSGVEATASGGRHTHPSSSVSRSEERAFYAFPFNASTVLL